MIDHQLSRRLFLRNGGVLSAAGAAAAPLALNMAAIGSAAAQSAGDYKALVCLFLFGGNDSLNTILPTDSASWANYTTVRNQAPDSIALMAPGTAAVVGAAAGTPARLGGVLPIAPTTARTAPGGGTQTFALHPLLGSLQTMFNTDKRLVSNVGPLVEPLTKDTYNNGKGRRPAMLFSHNDQTNTWMSSRPEGATVGWGGRLGRAAAVLVRLPYLTASFAAAFDALPACFALALWIFALALCMVFAGSLLVAAFVFSVACFAVSAVALPASFTAVPACAYAPVVAKTMASAISEFFIE